MTDRFPQKRRKTKQPELPPPLKEKMKKALNDVHKAVLNTEDENGRKLTERWRFDDDDLPAFGPEGPEDTDRLLVDDFSEECVPSRDHSDEVLTQSTGASYVVPICCPTSMFSI